MKGLEARWSGGPLYASETTCDLLAKLRRVPVSCLRPLRLGERVEADGFRVTALPANHCPGSVMFHLERRAAGGEAALYTGDFRLDGEVRGALARLGPVDVLYIDSTYADPRYSFPPQEEAVARVVEIVREASAAPEVMLAVYTIGKNRVVEAVARATGKPVYLPASKLRVYKLIGMGEFVTADRDSTNLRGYARGFFDEYFFTLPKRRREGAVVVIPTGWAEDEPSGRFRRGGAEFHYVPYSEHCDWREREETLSLVRAARVVDM
jgi:DNA cross-link repair 1A protein